MQWVLEGDLERWQDLDLDLTKGYVTGSVSRTWKTIYCRLHLCRPRLVVPTVRGYCGES